jgi:hypothetical protein
MDDVAKKNGKKGHLYTAGIDISNDQSQLAQRFITAAADAYSAGAQTVFRDHKHLADINALFSWAIRNKCVQAIDDLTFYLNGLPAVGGYSRAQAVMIGTGLIAPEALGVNLSKESMQFIKEQIEAKKKAQPVQEERPKE